MTGFAELWLPIVVSSVFVFIVSSLIHTILPWHKSDYPRVPDEDKVQNALRPLNIPPGDYMLPRASSMREMRLPEFKEKLDKGPVMVLTVLPNGMTSMTSSMILWFLYSLIVGFFSAYIAGRALPPGTEYLQVFRFTGATAFMCYAVALWQMSIWYRRDWSLTLKATVDGLIYALITGGTFGWLWPAMQM